MLLYPYPKAFSHIGITVPDLEKAVEFYQNVMGWHVLVYTTEVKEEYETSVGKMCVDAFGKGWKSLKIAHLSTSDKIGIELFEFSQTGNASFEPLKIGISHFCIQDPDIEGLTQKIVEAGGKQRMPVREYYPAEKPYRMVYVEDPFGIVFEIYSHSYELTYSPVSYSTNEN